MAAEDDIKRIIIVAEGDTLRQTEGPAPAPAGNVPAPQDVKEDFRAALDEIAQQMEAGLHPEPLLPAPSSASEADSYIEELIDTLRQLGGAGGPPQPPSMIPFGNAPYPSFASPANTPPITAPPSGGSPPPPAPPSPPSPPRPPAPPPVPSPHPGPPPVPPPVPPPPPTPPVPPPVPPGPPPIPPGGAPLGGLAGLAAELGPALIAMVAAEQILRELVDIAEQIDRHIMSLAEDIRPFSGHVQGADAYAELIRISTMMERAQAIGPDVATYQMQRAEFEAKLTRFITQLEAHVLPAVVSGMGVGNGALQMLINITQAAFNGIAALRPELAFLKKIFRDMADAQQEKYSAQDLDMLQQLDAMIRGNSEPFFRSKEEMEDAIKRHPLGSGVFF